MPTCVIIDQKMAAIQRQQRIFTGITESRAGGVEETLNALGVMGNYVQVGRNFEVYVSEYVKVDLVHIFIQANGFYRASDTIWIDGRIGEDETITDEDRIPDEYV